MSLLNQLDQITGRNAAPVEVANSNNFSQGLRQGMTSAGGSLRALAGGVGEAVGANDFAKAQYAKAAEAEQLAQTQAPEVSDWRQVADAPDLSTGLRRAGSYVAGLAGGAAPFVGAGAAATALTGGGAIPALLAGTAAVAPVEIGSALQRQQHDPAALANNSAGMRLGAAALEGTGRAAAMMAVPQLMGGKLMGKIEQTTARSMPAAVGVNLAEGVGGNALGGVAAEQISNTTNTALNPNRDTSEDGTRMLDAAVAGAALGVPFAGMGVAGHALHGKTPAPRTDGVKVDGGATPVVETAPVPKPSLQDRVKGLFTKEDDGGAEQIAADRDLVDADALRAAPPEQQGEILRAADGERMNKARAWADELLAGDKLSPENRAALAEQAKDLSSRASQTFVAGLKMATDTGSKVLNAATEFYDALSKPKEGEAPAAAPEGIKLSSISAGAEKAIGDAVAPHIDAKYPDLMKSDLGKKAVTGTLRRAMDDMQKTGKLDDGMAEHLHSWFGDDTPAVMADLHDKVMGDSPQATDRYFAAINAMTDNMGDHGKLADKVKAALTPEMQDKATPDSLRAAVKVMRDLATGEHVKDLPPARAAFEQKRVEATLAEHFGGNTTKLLAEFKKDADRRAAKLAAEEPSSAVTDKAKLDEGGFEDTPDAGVTRETDKIHYGGGGSDKANPTFVLSEKAHGAQFGGEGQASRLLRQARADHPDMNVMTVPAEVYAREQGWGKQQLDDATNGNPRDHVMIRAEGIKREGLSWRDIESMKNDSHNYPDSPSKIVTDAGVTLDAVKVMNSMAQEHKLARNETDALSPLHRQARQFKEAIAQISDHLGEAIDVPDETVVSRAGGKVITWKEMQEKTRVPDSDPALRAANNEREAAAKQFMKGESKESAADAAARLVKLDDENDARVMRANDPQDVLPDGAPKKNAVNNDRADLAARERVAATAKRLGAARSAVEAEMAKNGPLRDAEGNVQRKLTLRERKLVREHDAIIKDYDRAESGVGRDRPTEFDAAKDQLMMGEAPLDRNIHWGEKEYGDQLGARFKASELQDPQNGPLHASNFEPDLKGKMSPNVISAIGTKINRLENGTPLAWRAVGARARGLFDLVESGQMRMSDVAELASIVKDNKVSSVAETVDALVAKYEGVVAQPKKPSAFVERVIGKGDVSEVTRAIKASNDVAEVRRAIDALAAHDTDASARAVLTAANERIEHLIEKDPTLSYNMQRAAAKGPLDLHDQGAIAQHIEKVLGTSVDVEFKKMLHAGEFERGTAGANDVIRVSVHALDPYGTAYHESLHGFMSKLSDANLGDKAHPLFKAAMGEHVQAQLRTLLHGETDALAQLADPHESAAYMYQFWAQDKLKVGGKPHGILEKMAAMFQRVMGMWTNDQRAEHIMDYFNTGEYANQMGDRNAVMRSLEARSTIKAGLAERAKQFGQMVGPLDTLAKRVAFSGDAQVRGFKNAALTEIIDKVYSPMQGAHDDVGYLPVARAKRTQVLNDLAGDLAGYDAAITNDALAALQRGEKGNTPQERQVVLRVRKMLDEMHGYMKEAGVAVDDLGVGKDYFPRVWDTNKILANEKGFREMMQHYVDKGDFNGSVDQVIAALTRSEGSDLQVETAKPGMQFTRQRVLSFIAGRDAQPFLNENMYQTLNSYVSQATRRSEWSRRFGDDGSGLKKLMEDARKAGADDTQIATTMKYLKAVDGTLGDSIDPKLRRAFGNAIVYQNIRILPMMIFSSMIDAGGIMVRGGKVSEAFSTFKRGFSEIPEGFKKAGNQKRDAAVQLAETMGTIDSAVLMHTLGSSYSQGMTSDMGRRVNDTLFKYNLAEQYNRSMRVGATEAAVSFLGRHADGTESIHSKRWLAELGFKPGDVKLDAAGRPLLHAHEFEAAGMAPDAASAASDRMAVAVNKWVDGAILRPNAAHKPLWMSDPHFALVAHLKQFVYSFQETILKRVVNEARHGNVGPAYSLAAYVPFMLAADLAKGALLNGGGVPSGRQNWDASDYAAYEMQRAGLFGVGQFAIDAAKDIHRGGMGIGALTGPTLEQLGDAASTIGGTQQFKTFALNSMPANQLYDAVESASTNSVD